MAMKNGSYEKFKAIQLNNEEIAQQDFAGMRRSPEGWHLKGSAANSIMGGQPLLKAGGAGANILDIAANEPKPKTTGQAILKAAGQWKPLNDFYKNGVAAAPGNQPASTKNKIAELTAQKRAQAEASQVTDQREQAQTTPGFSSVEASAQANATAAGTPSAAKTYTVNGSQMTLGEYIKALGTDPNAAYRQNVAAANAAYDRQRATYGAEAEALAGQGLTHSGTSDHLDAQAYAAKQKAISQAAASRDQQMTEIAGQHMTYLQQEKAAQDAKIQTALERAASMQLNSANTVKYLMAMTGMTKSEAERYAEGNAALLVEEDNEDNTQATLQEITQTYLALMKSAEDGGMGMSSEAARQYLKSGTYSYDTALVDQAVNNLVGAQEQAKVDQTAEAKAQVAKVIDGIWNDGYTNDEVIASLAQVGVTLVQNEDGVIDPSDTMNAITNAYNRGLITEADYQKLHRKNVDDAVTDAKDKKSLGDLLQTAVDYSHDTGLQKYAYDMIKDEVSIDHVKSESPTNSKNDANVYLKVNGKKTQVSLELDAKAAVPDAVQKQNAKGGTLVAYNGALYIRQEQKYLVGGTGDARWVKVKSNLAHAGSTQITKEQCSELYTILVQKLQKKQ